jgi:hypothetical protein
MGVRIKSQIAKRLPGRNGSTIRLSYDRIQGLVETFTPEEVSSPIAAHRG